MGVNIVRPLNPRVPHPQNQQTMDKKIFEKKFQSSKKQNLNLPFVSSYLHMIYIVFATVYTVQEEKGTTEDEMAGWHHQLDGREFE